jgi:hypothetical protein
MIYFYECFDVLIKNEMIEKIISIIEDEKRKERISNEFEIYEVYKNKVLKNDISIHLLLKSLVKLIRFTDITSLLKMINKEQIKSLYQVVGIYFYSLGPFLYFPSIISLILNYLMTKNIRDDEEKEFILKIEKQLLLSWEEAVNSLIGKRLILGLGTLIFLLIFLLYFCYLEVYG